MDLRVLAAAQIALLDDGKVIEALERFFAPTGVMYDNDTLFAEGLAACRAKQEPFLKRAKEIRGRIEDAAVDEAASVLVFRNRTSFVDADDREVQIDGIHQQTWSEGKVVEERYYRDELMAQKLEAGILTHGEPL